MSQSTILAAIAAALSSGGGFPFLPTPKLLLPQSVAAASLLSVTQDSTAAAFFTGAVDSIDRDGAVEASSKTGDTYYTIANIAQAGFLAAVVGPTGSSGDITTVRVTPDGGSAVTFTAQLGATGDRAVFGNALRSTFFYASGTGTFNPDSLQGAVPADGKTKRAGNLMLMRAQEAFKFGKVFGWNSSCLIEIKHSATVSSDTNRERRVGAIYQLY